MHEMDHGLRSSEGIIKRKTLSGCLIIKKKPGNSLGVGAIPRNVTERRNLDHRERGNLGVSVSSSSEESLQPIRRGNLGRDDRFYSNPVMHGEGISGSSIGFARSAEFGERRRKLDGVELDENVSAYTKRTRTERDDLRERYGSRRDLDSDCSGYGMLDKQNNSYSRTGSADEAQMPCSPPRQKFRVPSIKPIRVQGKNGVLKVMVHKSKNADVLRRYYGLSVDDDERFDRTGSRSGIPVNSHLSGGPSVHSELRHFEKSNSSARIRNSEPELQSSFTKRARPGDSETEGSDLLLNPELTSMVKKNKHKTQKSFDHQQQDFRRGSGLEIDINNNAPAPMLYSDFKNRNSQLPRVGKNKTKVQNSLSKRVEPGDSETGDCDSLLKQDKKSVRVSSSSKGVNNNAPAPMLYSDSKNRNSQLPRVEKNKTKVQNSLSKRVEPGDSETGDCDSLSKQDKKSERVSSSSKGVIKRVEKTPIAEKVMLAKGKETKVKRGTGTEKQLLREKIRQKLVTAGWKIDYRPRKNRDYLDAVYINPSGTAYWSIIKAYEAFKKQMGEEDVPEELLNKLTRQTRKKMEMKQREEARTNKIKDVASEEEAEETTENEDNDEKLSLIPKQNDKSIKRKAEKPFPKTNSRMIQERKTEQIGRSTLMVRSSDKALESETDGYVPYMGKRTVLSWLIDSGTIQESAEVQYMNRKRTKVMLKGWAARNGIHCGCCSKILTVSKFEMHAGSKLHKPFENMFLESGISLLQCQIEAWDKQDEVKRRGFNYLNIDDDEENENDDACGLCGDGGDLICCDGCPSTYHQSCIGIEVLPPGDWHCPNCTCKFCEKSSAQGNGLLTCSMCERKYHDSCGVDIDAIDASCADFNRESTTFCGKQCLEVFNQSQKLLEVKHELEAGFSWSLIHRTHTDTDVSQRGFPQKVETNSKLAVALSVIEECFLPIIDRRSGINLVHNVVYNRGSNYSRLNHSGFYTAILERRDEIIAAASIRIHGTQLAEMPFIGTRHIYRRQGMCRRLLYAIESALSYLKVGKLIIPVIGEDMQTWTRVFGFKTLGDSHKKEMRSLKMLVFPRTVMLQKTLGELNTIKPPPIAESGEYINLSRAPHNLTPDVQRSSEFDPPLRHDSNVRDDASLRSSLKTADSKPAVTDSCSQSTNADASPNSSSDMPSETNLKVLNKEDSVHLEIGKPTTNTCVEGSLFF